MCTHINANIRVAAAEVEKAETVSSGKSVPRGLHRKHYWNNFRCWLEGSDAVTVSKLSKFQLGLSPEEIGDGLGAPSCVALPEAAFGRKMPIVLLNASTI